MSKGMTKAQWCAGHMEDIILVDSRGAPSFDSYEVQHSNLPGYANVIFYEESTPVATSRSVPIEELFFDLMKRLPGWYKV